MTGPPGTGKTQLVVNAVTNAWLDGEKVLVTSTNNAAVDVAVARAEADVFSGLLMRTGNRTVREHIPDRITAAVARAEAHTGDPAEARARVEAERRRAHAVDGEAVSAEQSWTPRCCGSPRSWTKPDET